MDWFIETSTNKTTIPSDIAVGGLAAVDYYFLDDEGGSFKATLQYDPYFLVSCSVGHEVDVEEYIRRILNQVKRISRQEKEDLSLANHLMGNRRLVLKLEFNNINDLLAARKVLNPIVENNLKSKQDQENFGYLDGEDKRSPTDCIENIYEYDVPYHVRVSIDLDIRVGKWYKVEAKHGETKLTEQTDRIARADPVVMAYDIETTKLPLKFPDATFDKIMMISYMIDGQGYLIINREIVSKDIDDFEYTPKPEFKGEFCIFNEQDEKALLDRFFDHIREEKPTIIATFNGDFFDWPFVEARAAFHGMDMFDEIGFKKDSEGEYKSAHCAHMDCFRWVQRDSYLPQGSQGLKAVTTAKLGYNPIEVDPELMTPYAVDKPQVMAEYSVSDAVATYYLYMKYVHPFIFSLCTIIPLNPDEVLRKGTGTLCEMLLMVQAYKGNIVFPHKHKDPIERFFEGHLIESETYVGGHVESLEAGVFRSDIPSKFKIDTTAVDEILGDLDDALKFSIEIENKKKLEDVENYNEVKQSITDALLQLKQTPDREEPPLIYHVDVASMYPNIMTTNRLQPDSIVTEHDCARCDYNVPGKNCDRRLPWSWRGEYSPAKKDEYLMIRRTLETERFPLKSKYNVKGRSYRIWEELSTQEQAELIKKRLNEYSRKVYHRVKQSKTVEREAIICQKENPFYVDTVRSFRDRRYEFKGLQKIWKGKVGEASDPAAKEEAKKMVVLYDSLQLAHKVILNSFYGYVMRKGSRWYSMPMAGVTCLTGATIIQMARSLVERLGRPLELDTDGIWCILPKSFPEDYTFKLKGGKKLVVSYPCVMLNHLVHARFTNDQYHTLNPDTNEYEVSSDNSIFFEVDGPYRAMILPTSKEEDKNLKKRYAVFNDDGSLAELKGFEIKRRGELRIIKAFQSQIFSVFLQGSTLKECYGAVAKVADSWLDILSSKGSTLEDEDLMDLISENRSMSKQLDEYEGQKSTSICTARRLAEFLGMQMVKDKGLACKYVISKEPASAPVSERAVPVAIFSAELSTKSHYLRKWLKDPSLDDFDPRSIIDWGYYWERLGSTIQKIITIPAALQHVPNPVPRVEHPDWLRKRLEGSKMKQKSISFAKAQATDTIRESFAVYEKQSTVVDIEDIENIPNQASRSNARVVKRSRRNDTENLEPEYPSLPAVVPSIDNYKEWLKYNKIKWNLQKQARRTRLQLFGESKTNTGSAMSNMVRNQFQQTYSGTVWHILSYQKTSTLGEVKALALIHGVVHRVRIIVPRRLYVSLRPGYMDEVYELLPPGCHLTESRKKVAASSMSRAASSPTALYELTMTERAYQTMLVKPNNVLKHRAVVGVHESQVESQDRTILELGNRVVLSQSEPGLLGKGLEKGFDLKWLRPLSDQRKQETCYLNEVPDFIHLAHIVSGDISIISVITSWNTAAHTFILRPGSQPGLANINTIYEEELARWKRTNPAFADAYQTSLEFEEHMFASGSDQNMFKKLGSILAALYSERGTKAVVCIQSPVAAKLRRSLRSLDEFATVEIGSRQSTPLPPMLWQKPAAQRLARFYLKARTWLAHQVDVARQGNIPIGNLTDIKYVMDVMYGRKLMEQQIVLWWSRSALSDHGGAEKDVLVNKIAESQSLMRFNTPGVYVRPCIEISLANCVVNATLTSVLENTAVDFDTSVNMDAVTALVDLLKSWWQLAAATAQEEEEDDGMVQNQALVGDQRFADSLVQNFVSWVCSNESLLYDDGLHDYINTLTRQSFVRFMGDFKKLGVSVVFADNSRIIVNTNKSSVRHTFAFADFLVKAIRAKPSAYYMDLSVRKYWETLIWMDEFNFSGYEYADVESSKEYVSSWHIARFLPELLATEFETYVTLFGQRVRSAGNQLPQSYNTAVQSRPADISSQTQKENKEEDEQRKAIAAFVFDDVQKMLNKRLVQLFNKYNDSLANPDLAHLFKLPVRAGTRSQTTSNPLLLFVQCISEVFSLWDYLSLESRLIKRSLLRVLSLSEFSSEAQFVDPSASLVIPDIICKWCGSLWSLDVCKQDADDIGGVGVTAKLHVWSCHRCHKPFSRVVLEELLVKQLHRELARFQLQDLKCSRCHRIREDNMAVTCPCSGEYLETVSSDHMVNIVDVYNQVARFYSMDLVLDALTFVY